ncbi:carbohydrate sulfotransferase 11-like isoform X3 [Portunus trituberculatus]|uniref:carbohydrate sulfotransferase 11-like isoform X3 n=1 Tax=Portunus trituberculatus TaxID=210409 RepID=UPI001E1CEE2B|nr:carbohydrate sulfotransferase 11-like isoform X3 [Portunus trituberculatus]
MGMLLRFVSSWFPMKVLTATLLLLCAGLLISWNMEYKNIEWNAKNAKTRSDILLQQVRETCATMRFPNTLANTAIRHMVYDDKRKVIYCFIPKVASTSWKRVFLLLTQEPKRNVSKMSRQAVHGSLPFLSSDMNKEEKLRTYKKFMVVRHPFERILSAYRDKLEDWELADGAFPRKVKKRIERDNPNKKPDDNITFTEFIRFISEPGKVVPEQRDEHWLPMHELCHPCSVQYDFISKYENLQEDSDYLLNWMDATDPKYKFPRPSRAFHANRYDPKYFGKLSHEEIKAFYAKYMPDFLLFNYDFL